MNADHPATGAILLAGSQAFRQWLERDPENQRAYDAAEQLLGDARTAIKSDPALESFKAKSARSRKTVTSGLLGLTIVAGLFLYLDGPMRLQADVISGVAELPVIELDDGSTVHMNAECGIRNRSRLFQPGQAHSPAARRGLL
ncbi:DUF4880 domain-containing protein [Breoghania sp. L-A4]|uniref:FecR family protein n=1 Tax=Breoghania sp. L-A4 TaxID=2304600 RepID=UPI0013C33462|nr:DUF4880 domain-containing protein [Breoghania sp. L-A4]